MASPNTGTITQYANLIYQSAIGLNEHDPVEASADQTLATISQAGVASSLEQMVVGSATAREEIFDTVTMELVDLAIGSSSTSAVLTDELSSVVTANEEITGDRIVPLSDTALVSDSINTQQTSSLESTARATEKIEQSVSLLLTSTIQASDSQTTSRTLMLSDTATVSDELVPVGHYYIELSSTAYASENFAFGQEEIIVENIVARDTLTGWNVISETVISTAAAGDQVVGSKTSFELLADSALASESFAFDGSVYNELIHDTALVSDWIWAKDFGSVAWVLNTQSGGLSNYDNYGFTSMAFHNGKLYATSPEGLFELDADDDTGRDINSTLGFGFLDFGTENKKHISDIFLGCTGNDIECDVETFDKLTYTYDMEYRESSSPYNNRIKPGRGLSSRWWRFTFRNIGGADFQIHDIAVEVAKSKRRL